MPDKAELRDEVRTNLAVAIRGVNSALRGDGLARLAPTLARLGRGGELPHWYNQLLEEKTLPNLDGKTVGSVVEMLLLAVLELDILAAHGLPPMKINPARGVDFPDLDLSVKSPSENFCTSEPFFSAYDRLIGGEHDVLVLLTDYQRQKRNPPLRLQVITWEYLSQSELADIGLCEVARLNRDWLVTENEAWAKKVFRFLAYVNQSDWRAKHLLALVRDLNDENKIRSGLAGVTGDFDRINKQRARKNRLPLLDSDLAALTKIGLIDPLRLGVIDAADSWVIDVLGDAARSPSENEWNRLLASPLNGRIGMSFALQWRYNFGRIFPAATRAAAGGVRAREDDGEYEV